MARIEDQLYLERLLKTEGIFHKRFRIPGRIRELYPWSDIRESGAGTGSPVYILFERDNKFSGYTKKTRSWGMRMLLQLEPE